MRKGGVPREVASLLFLKHPCSHIENGRTRYVNPESGWGSVTRQNSLDCFVEISDTMGRACCTRIPIPSVIKATKLACPDPSHISSSLGKDEQGLFGKGKVQHHESYSFVCWATRGRCQRRQMEERVFGGGRVDQIRGHANA